MPILPTNIGNKYRVSGPLILVNPRERSPANPLLSFFFLRSTHCLTTDFLYSALCGISPHCITHFFWFDIKSSAFMFNIDIKFKFTAIFVCKSVHKLYNILSFFFFFLFYFINIFYVIKFNLLSLTIRNTNPINFNSSHEYLPC